MALAVDERSAWFKGWGLPALLLAPQLLIVLIFFYWPSVQAIYSSFFLEDAFGQGAEFVGLETLSDCLLILITPIRLASRLFSRS